jgi:hypothetical protein
VTALAVSAAHVALVVVAVLVVVDAVGLLALVAYRRRCTRRRAQAERVPGPRVGA